MNRRSLLAMIGAAPVASCAPMPALAGESIAALPHRGEFIMRTPNDIRMAADLAPLQSLTVQFDEGMIARTVRDTLARHGIHDPSAPAFTDGDGI